MPTEMDYTNRDYESIRSFLVTVARERMPEWVTAGEPADMGTMIMELFAYAEDITNFYIDRAAAEPFLKTAVRRQSVLAIADLFNYKPVSRQAASVVLTFTLDASATTLTIPTGTLVRIPNRNDVVYETGSELVLANPGTPTGTVLAYEGRTRTNEYLGDSNGAPLQVYPLLNESVIERSLHVEIEEADGRRTVWTYVDYLADVAFDASVYTTVLDDLGNVMVRFGDSLHGRIPPTMGRIFVTYRTGAGAAGNTPELTISEMVTPLAGVSVINMTAASGGADPESLDQMRNSIPRATRVLDRAVTLDDYAALAMQVPTVAKSTARGDYYTSIFINIAPVGGGMPDTALKDYVKSYVEARSVIGASVFVQDPTYVDLVLDITVHVRHEYPQLTTQTQVQDALKDLFAFENSFFGEKGRVTLGSIYEASQSPPGVAYVTVNAFHELGQPNPSPLVDFVPDDVEIPRLDDANLTITMEGGLLPGTTP